MWVKKYRSLIFTYGEKNTRGPSKDPGASQGLRHNKKIAKRRRRRRNRFAMRKTTATNWSNC